MYNERVIDFLLSINNKTRREKIEVIKGSIDSYKQFLQGNSYREAEQAFGDDFLGQANKLISDIEKDTSISYDRDWNWFYNADNIPNQELVFQTSDFLEIERKDVFNPLYFFNLLFKQMDELKDSLDRPFDYVADLKKMPLSETQLSILLGMILYWHGGFPVKNLNKKYNTILKLVEKAFLELSPDELELKFCQGNLVEKSQLKELERKLNLEINLEKEMPENKKADATNQRFRFSGTKINLIRLLNALYELKLITLEGGLLPTKESFMRETGLFFGIDLAKYDVDLSQAFGDGNIEKNISFFSQMKEVTEKLVKQKI